MGSRPPSPIPQKSRKSPNSSGLGARAQASIHIENQAMLNISIFLRPRTSVARIPMKA